MMHNNIMFDRDREYGNSNTMRKNRMKRMEELSHSLDDGLNNLPDDYGRSHRGSTSGRRIDPRYDDMDEEDDYDDDYIDDYYYSNSKPSYCNRPRSYNEKYSYSYDDYDNNFNQNRYSLNEAAMNKNSRYQQSPSSQQKYSSLRKPQDTKGLSSSSGNSHHGSNKHILFNEEDNVMYMNEKKKSTTSSSSSSNKKAPAKRDIKKETTMNETITASTKKKQQTKEDLSPATKSDKSSSLQVMKAKLKIHNLSNDDSVLQTRSNKLQNAFHRHHSVESRMPPSPHHHSDRSNMSPTIFEEIEFEIQDVETEKESEPIESDRDKKGKDKSKDKDKKGNSSTPSTPTTKKSLKAHLINQQKKLFKVPDIDLNNLKFSCLFSSNKIAALKGKKEESTTKSAETLNEPSSSSKSSPKSSPTTKSPPTSSIATAPTKTPPLSPKKIIKSESKSDKSAQERANVESAIVEEKYGKIIKVDDELDEGCGEEEIEESVSDDEFQVIYNKTANNDDVESIKTFLPSY